MRQIWRVAEQPLDVGLCRRLLPREAMEHAETAECNCEQHYGCAGVRDRFGNKQSNRSNAAIRKIIAWAGLRECELTGARASDQIEIEASSLVECRVPRSSGGIVDDGIAEAPQFDRRIEIFLESWIAASENGPGGKSARSERCQFSRVYSTGVLAAVQ